MSTISPEGEHGLGFNMDMAKDKKKAFCVTLGIFQIAMCILFFTTTTYEDSSSEVTNFNAGLATDVSQYYSFYSNVAFMIWIGFGYLMSFLRKYSFSAIGLNMLMSSVAFEWGIMCMSFFHHIGSTSHTTVMNISWLIEGCFAAGCCMITFGALIGKVSPLQLLWVILLEIPFYALNFYIGATTLGAKDVGGSMFVHMFGAYFGIACTLVMAPGRPKDANGDPIAHDFNGSRTTGDVTAMIGTIFLWILWPSFNGALAPAGTQFRVIVNTVLSLNGSCVTAFLFSRLFSKEGKFDMVHIQNATLAGGVAVGSSADLVIGPGGALTVGAVAGFLSTFGYVYIHPFLERKIGLDDTCGVNNLHGMPGIMGAVVGAISCNAASASVYGVSYSDIFGPGRNPSNQPDYQVMALFITLGISLSSGALVGFIVKTMPKCFPGVKAHGAHVGNGSYPDGYFEDEPYWETCHDYQKC